MDEIEKLYTVQTERMVYTNIKEGRADTALSDNQDIEGDLELF